MRKQALSWFSGLMEMLYGGFSEKSYYSPIMGYKKERVFKPLWKILSGFRWGESSVCLLTTSHLIGIRIGILFFCFGNYNPSGVIFLNLLMASSLPGQQDGYLSLWGNTTGFPEAFRIAQLLYSRKVLLLHLGLKEIPCTLVWQRRQAPEWLQWLASFFFFSVMFANTDGPQMTVLHPLVILYVFKCSDVLFMGDLNSTYPVMGYLECL